MAKVNLCLDTIGELDGGMAQAIIDAEIVKAVADLEDRGQDGKPRHVVIDLVLTINEKTGTPIMEVCAQAKLPPRRSGGTVAEQKHTQEGQFLAFQSMNPERHDQPTFPTLDKNDAE